MEAICMVCIDPKRPVIAIFCVRSTKVLIQCMSYATIEEQDGSITAIKNHRRRDIFFEHVRLFSWYLQARTGYKYYYEMGDWSSLEWDKKGFIVFFGPVSAILFIVFLPLVIHQDVRRLRGRSSICYWF